MSTSAAPADSSEASTLAAEEDAGEELRKLYVAATRAQSQLVAWWMPSSRNTGTSALNRLVFGRRPGDARVPASARVNGDADVRRITTAWQEAGAFAVETCSLDPTAGMPAAADPGALAVRRFTRTLDRSWTRTSYSGLAHAAAEHEASDPDRLRAVSEPEDPPREDEPPLPDALDLRNRLGRTGSRPGAVPHVRPPRRRDLRLAGPRRARARGPRPGR